MCGLFGVFGTAVNEAPLLGALAALAARGPDGGDFVRLTPEAVFGHTRLSIIDLDQRADQPMFGLDGRLAIIFNGEIYNAPALRAAIPDYPWTTDHSDTETILACYWKHGPEKFLNHLRGMFAFALWDQATRKLILAVDRFSIKPLLLTQRQGALYFSSNVAALAALNLPLAPHLPAVHSWLADGQLETGTETFFAGISQLPAAHYAVWREGRLEIRRYWSPPIARERSIPIAEIDGWVEEALTSHLLSDVPVGINLSSGIDSAVLRALAASKGIPLHGFTFSFPETPYDEAARLRRLVGDDANWTVTPIDPQTMWRDFAASTAALESPLGGVAIYGHWRNAQTARAAGYKVLLAGEGADEVFGGYKYYAEEAIKALWHAGRGAEAEELYRVFAARDPAEWPGTAARLAQQPRESVVRAPDGTSLASAHLTRDFAASPKLPDPPVVEGDPVRAAMWADLAHLKLPKLLRWQDRCYMASSVEIRVPYLDHVLIERMAGLGAADMFAGGLTKSALRRIGERLLPQAFLQQPKLYVATPQREWLKKDLRREVEELLNPDAMLVASGLIDLPALRQAYRDYAQSDALGNSFFIWKFIAMEFLFRCFFGSSAQAKLVA